MKNKFFKHIVAFTMLMFVFSAAFALTTSTVKAQEAAAEAFGLADLDGEINLSDAEKDPKTVAIDIINYLLTFLGIIAVVIILLGGFKWMTAAGNEDKVAEAKKLIVAGIIGLAIIMSAWVITKAVISAVDTNILQE
jgi:uncharacterized membrane protein YidH (DUF202 family)